MPADPGFRGDPHGEFQITATSTYLYSVIRGPLPRAHVAAVEGLCTACPRQCRSETPRC